MADMNNFSVTPSRDSVPPKGSGKRKKNSFRKKLPPEMRGMLKDYQIPPIVAQTKTIREGTDKRIKAIKALPPRGQMAKVLSPDYLLPDTLKATTSRAHTGMSFVHDGPFMQNKQEKGIN